MPVRVERDRSPLRVELGDAEVEHLRHRPGAGSAQARKMLSGLMSRWTMPCLCAAATPRIASARARSMRWTGSVRARAARGSDSPSRNSITRNTVAAAHHVVHVDHVRVTHARRCVRLAQHALDRVWLRRQLVVHPLDGDALAAERVLRLVDDAHAALPQQTDDAVLAVIERAARDQVRHASSLLHESPAIIKQPVGSGKEVRW